MTNERFTCLAKKYMDTVFRVAFSYMKNRADADDVTQNVLLKLYRHEGEFESEAHVKHWLIRVAVNECRSAWRAPWRKHEDIAEYANALAMPSRKHEELFGAVMALPQKYRVVIYLFYYEGYTTRELAALLSMPEATVRTHLARGRERLRKTLTEEENYGQTAF